jgi:hypothetical protein
VLGLATRDGEPRVYRVSVPEVGGGRSETVLAGEVLHVRIRADAATAWAGQAPLRRAAISAGLLHELESALRDTFMDAPLGSQILSLDMGEGWERMRGALRGRGGASLFVEYLTHPHAAGAPAPKRDGATSLAPILRDSMTVEHLEQARSAILMAFGVLPAMLNQAATGPARVTPHVAQKARRTATDGRTARHAGYALSQQRRKRYPQTLYAGLEAETGIATGLKQNGSLSVALTDERLEELHRGAAMARAFGLEGAVLSAEEAAARHPLLNRRQEEAESEEGGGGRQCPERKGRRPTNISIPRVPTWDDRFKRALLLAADTAGHPDPVLAEVCWRLMTTRGHHRQALCAVAGRLVERILRVLRSGASCGLRDLGGRRGRARPLGPGPPQRERAGCRDCASTCSVLRVMRIQSPAAPCPDRCSGSPSPASASSSGPSSSRPPSRPR